ncbi:MAG: flagellar biosynthetic protein FliR [Desulfobacteraceae bacterium]|nr:flagellar biosynthetic protein FliR [Desulfobacteraceae bacterium]
MILLRVTAILFTAPIFNSRNIPVLFKVGLSFAVSLILLPILNLQDLPVRFEAIPLVIGIISEIVIGIIIGLSVRMIFVGIQLAGQLVGFQMGLAMANIIDPATSEQVPLLAQLNNLIALLIFLAINAHYWFLRALVESFRLVPPFEFQFTNSLMEQLMSLAGNIFIIAVKVGAPLIVVLLLMSVAFGLAARTVPQMNIFFVAMPLKILVGLIFLLLALPYMTSFFESIFSGLGNDILRLLNAM